MPHLWTVFGGSPKLKGSARLHITGAPATEEDVREHVKAHYPAFTITAIAPGHVEKAEEAKKE